MATPNASYSVRMRVEIAKRPGTLGRLTMAIGDAGGDVEAVDIVEIGAEVMIRDIVVLAADDAHAAQIRAAAEAVDGVRVASVNDRTFLLHEGGKIEITSRVPLASRDDLSMAYTPGVARVCTAIAEDPALSYRYTARANMVAVITDGTAVLGLGNIGPEAAMPVMEGKAVLFKTFAGVDAVPICLRAGSADEIVAVVEAIAPSFGGINLEDIAAPRCFEVEARLKASLDIPVFHDDQHGTAVVALAALWNAVRIVGKKITDLRVVIAGAGAAGVAIAKILQGAGVPDIVACDRQGALGPHLTGLDPSKQWLADHCNPQRFIGSLADVLRGADVFIGVSGPGVLQREAVAAMAEDPIVFALANPTPEIMPEDIEGIAAVIATGRSDYPNQINNVLCFPGIFRGALDAHATDITDGMKLAASEAIAAEVSAEDLSPDYIIPSVFNRNVAPSVAARVAAAARLEGVVRR